MQRLERFDYQTQNDYLNQGIMPTAVVCIRDSATSLALGVYSCARDELVGLPTTDIVQLDPPSNGYPAETVEHYVRYRLKKRFGAQVIKETVKWNRTATEVSDEVVTVSNSGFERCKRRIFLPIFGQIEIDDPCKLQPHNGNLLVLADDEILLESIESQALAGDSRQKIKAYEHALIASLATI